MSQQTAAAVKAGRAFRPGQRIKVSPAERPATYKEVEAGRVTIRTPTPPTPKE